MATSVSMNKLLEGELGRVGTPVRRRMSNSAKGVTHLAHARQAHALLRACFREEVK